MMYLLIFVLYLNSIELILNIQFIHEKVFCWIWVFVDQKLITKSNHHNLVNVKIDLWFIFILIRNLKLNDFIQSIVWFKCQCHYLFILLFVHSLEKENEGLRSENYDIREEISEMRAYINKLEADLQEKDNKLV